MTTRTRTVRACLAEAAITATALNAGRAVGLFLAGVCAARLPNASQAAGGRQGAIGDDALGDIRLAPSLSAPPAPATLRVSLTRLGRQRVAVAREERSPDCAASKRLEQVPAGAGRQGTGELIEA